MNRLSSMGDALKRQFTWKQAREEQQRAYDAEYRSPPKHDDDRQSKGAKRGTVRSGAQVPANGKVRSNTTASVQPPGQTIGHAMTDHSRAIVMPGGIQALIDAAEGAFEGEEAQTTNKPEDSSVPAVPYDQPSTLSDQFAPQEMRSAGVENGQSHVQAGGNGHTGVDAVAQQREHQGTNGTTRPHAAHRPVNTNNVSKPANESGVGADADAVTRQRELRVPNSTHALPAPSRPSNASDASKPARENGFGVDVDATAHQREYQSTNKPPAARRPSNASDAFRPALGGVSSADADAATRQRERRVSSSTHAPPAPSRPSNASNVSEPAHESDTSANAHAVARQRERRVSNSTHTPPASSRQVNIGGVSKPAHKSDISADPNAVARQHERRVSNSSHTPPTPSHPTNANNVSKPALEGGIGMKANAVAQQREHQGTNGTTRSEAAHRPVNTSNVSKPANESGVGADADAVARQRELRVPNSTHALPAPSRPSNASNLSKPAHENGFGVDVDATAHQREYQSTNGTNRTHASRRPVNDGNIAKRPHESDISARLVRALDDNKRLEAELNRARNDARQREADLVADLTEVQKQLDHVKADRAAMRVFGETEVVDGQTLVTLFDDFIEAVNDLLLSVIDELGEETQTAPVTLDRVYNFARTNRYAERILTSFLKPMAQAHAKVELIVLSLMQYTTFSLLAEYVFIPTSLAVKDIKDMSIRPSEAGFVDVNQYLQYLQDCVAAREPQEKYGRWRTIFYGAIRATNNEDNEFALQGASAIYNNITDVLVALLPPSVVPDAALGQRLFGGFKERATKVFLDAIKLQDMMQRTYVSHDYTLLFPPCGSPYIASDMEVSDLGLEATRALRAGDPQPLRDIVLLPVTPGLCTTRIQSNHSRLHTVVKPASVVTWSER